VAGQLNSQDLYATVESKSGANEPEKGGCEETKDKEQNQDLPPGWEKHEDEHGAYYWHIKTGVTQREPPAWQKELKTPVTATNPYQFMVPKSTAPAFSSPLDSMYSSALDRSEGSMHSQGIMPRSKTVTEINRTDTSYK
jgi:amyloid beta A4 precursor protein-binding family B member 2